MPRGGKPAEDPWSTRYGQAARLYMEGKRPPEIAEIMGVNVNTVYAYVEKARKRKIIPGVDSNPYWMARELSRSQGVRAGSLRDVLEGLSADEFRWLARDVMKGEVVADAVRRAVQLSYDMVMSDQAVKKGQSRLRKMGAPGRNLSPTAGEIMEREADD